MSNYRKALRDVGTRDELLFALESAWTNLDNQRRYAHGPASMLLDVERFHQEIVRTPWPDAPRLLEGDRKACALVHLDEEMKEFAGAETVEDQADALVDIVYVALGRLLEMGILPGAAFDAVHEANMTKHRGRNERRPDDAHDAVKPEGWKPPDLAKAMSVTLADVRALSPVLLEVTRLRAKKGRDYNAASVAIEDYFPLGHQSYFQMLFVKVRRIQSLIGVMGKGGTPANESLRDTLLDLMNYAIFYVEWIDAQVDKELVL